MPTTSDTFTVRLPKTDRTFRGPLQEPAVNTTSALTYTAGRSRMTDRQVMGWRKRIARGDSATTKLVGSIDRNNWRAARAYRYLYDASVDVPPWYGQSRWEITGFLPGVSLAPPSSVTAAMMSAANNEALASFISNARRVQGQFSGLTFMGELAETIRMFARPVRSFRAATDTYVSRLRTDYARRMRGVPRVQRPRITRRYLSDSWLEWSFGVQPLLSDAEDAAKALASLQDVVIREMVSGSAVRTVATSALASWQGNSINSGILGGRYNLQSRAEYYVRYYGKVKVELDDNGRRVASSAFGTQPSWSNFIPTIWEVIPYSFLVDYFTNAGEVISAFSFNRASVRWCTKLIRDSRTTSATGFSLNPVSFPQYRIRGEAFHAPDVSRSTVSVNRDLYTGSLIPDLQVEIPGIGSLRWLNIAALARSRRLF